jgi:hypothetical protein
MWGINLPILLVWMESRLVEFILTNVLLVP